MVKLTYLMMVIDYINNSQIDEYITSVRVLYYYDDVIELWEDKGKMINNKIILN